MKRSTLLLTLTLAIGTPQYAAAQPTPSEDSAITELPPAQVPAIEPKMSERSGAFALRVGPYKPDDLLRNANAPVAFEDLYGDSPGVMYNIDWEYQPLHHKYIGALGIGLSAGFYRKTGNALKEDGTQSAQELALMIIPASAGITYRMELWPDQPLVPYGGAGLDYWYFSESKQGSSNSVSGAKKGWHWRAGGQLLLDIFDVRSAGALDANWGINNTYIFGEFRSSTINNFGDSMGFDFSERTWFAGLLFEY